MDLDQFFSQTPKLAVAFSGGTDSAYLLYEAKRHKIQVEAFYTKSCFQPEFELADAERFCYEQDIRLHIVAVDILHIHKVSSNPDNRCYYCKHAIFSTIIKVASDCGFSVLADGTNASDKESVRPGMAALRELSVVSPLMLAGLTKTEIRRRSEAAHLFTAQKPAYACLATRIPTGTSITESALRKIEEGEQYLSSLGFSDFRLRLPFPDTGLLQITPQDFPLFAKEKEKIHLGLSDLFSHIYLDMVPRKSSDGLKILHSEHSEIKPAIEKETNLSKEVASWNPEAF